MHKVWFLKFTVSLHGYGKGLPHKKKKWTSLVLKLCTRMMKWCILSG